MVERNCKNCGQMLYAGHDFCSKCGSKWVEFRLTPRKITEEFSHRYLGTDNVFLVTILALLRYPEDVINGYISGQRKKYVNPVNLYIISLSLVGLQIFILKHFAPESLGFDNIEGNGAEVIVNVLFDYIGLFTTLFLPVYAIIGYIVFLDIKKYNFTEHLVFCIYVFALLNIITALLTPLMIIFNIEYSVLSILITPLSILQFAWYYKRCFKLSVAVTILKTLLASFLYIVISIIYTLIVGAIAIGLIYLLQPEWLEALSITTQH